MLVTWLHGNGSGKRSVIAELVARVYSNVFRRGLCVMTGEA